MSRKVIFRTLVGSHNYNLNTEESDEDYKAFVMPTFEDLYNGKMFSKQVVGDEMDCEYHDIRKLPMLLSKANLNYVETLFSHKIQMSDDAHPEHVNIINDILCNKDRIAKMNLSRMYSACNGMFNQKMSMLDKGTKGTEHLVEKYGFDTKQAQHAFRIVDFIVRYHGNDFTSFGDAIRYSESSPHREFMMDIRNGKLSKEEFVDFMGRYKSRNFDILKKEIKPLDKDEEMHEMLKDSIYKLVKSGLEYSKD